VQKIKRTGLPDSVIMRHDNHYVDLISSRARGPQIRMIAIERIYPNPHQARSELGNMQELMASIKSKGILEPILVRPKGDRYEIIAGERRYIASKKIGLREIPCIEMDVKDNEAMELALIENLQRKDLDIFEEADGLKCLIEVYGYSHNDISDKLCKARSTVTEIVNISKIPKRIRDLCKKYDIRSQTTLIEISKLKNEEDMERLVTEIRERGLKREDTRELSKKIKGKVKKLKRYVYNYSPKDDDYCYNLRIEFKKQTVSKEEIIRILEDLIKKLKSQKI